MIFSFQMNQITLFRYSSEFWMWIFIDALIARDPVRAEKAMRIHIQNSLEYLKSVI